MCFRSIQRALCCVYDRKHDRSRNPYVFQVNSKKSLTRTKLAGQAVLRRNPYVFQVNSKGWDALLGRLDRWS